MNLYIFRHGETRHTKQQIPYRDKVYSAEIIPEGIPAIKRLAKFLKKQEIKNNYTSPFKRCVQTVNIVGEITGKEFKKDKRLGEYIFEKESFDEFFSRIKNFYREIKEKNYQKVSVCTHGYPIAALLQIATKGSIEAADLSKYPNPGVLIIVKDKKVKTLDFDK